MASEDIKSKSLTELVQIQVDWITAHSTGVLTAPVGPFITSLCYATALVALVLQRLVNLVYQASRLTTATGDDVDTFLADFGQSRNPASAASGLVTFGKLVAAPSQILIPNGTQVQTSAQPPVQFQVIGDPTQSNYDPVQLGYLFSAGATSATAVVQALVAGSAGNVAANSINKIASSLSGIDNVTNGLALVNGADEDSDDEARAAFVRFIQSLSKATPSALGAAVLQDRPFLIYNITEPYAEELKTLTTSGTNTTTKLYLMDTTGFGVGDQLFVDGFAASGNAKVFVATVSSDSGGKFITISPALTGTPGQGVAVWNVTPSGVASTQSGIVRIVIDDGNGTAGAYVSAVANDVNNARAAGVRVDVTAATPAYYGIVAEVTYNPALVLDFTHLTAVVRSSVLELVNLASKPGGKTHYSTLYRAIFDAVSPGDAVSTVIATAPASTTNLLYVGSTTGMATGQLLNIGGVLAAGGVYPKIVSINSSTSVSIDPSLPSIPAANTPVSAFSVDPAQIKDIHNLRFNPIVNETTVVSDGSNSSLQLKVASTTGMAGGNKYLIITNENTAGSPIYYQADPNVGLLPRINSLPGGSIVTFNTDLGVIGADGVWRKADGSGSNPAIPAVGTKVAFISDSAGTSDVTAGATTVIRTKGSGANGILIQFEPEPL